MMLEGLNKMQKQMGGERPDLLGGLLGAGTIDERFQSGRRNLAVNEALRETRLN
jgi:hypothetical protein